MFADAFNAIKGALGKTISSALESILNATLFRLFYYLEIALCKIVGLLNEMFEVFAGINKVTYNGEKEYLINIFFYNRSINNVYWGMALIGIVLAFGFAIAAVVRKLFDSGGKVQESLGQTITSFLRSVFLIIGLSAIMVVVLNSTNVLMQQINFMFNNAENLDIPVTIVYTDEQYAAMGRVLNTIGNYSLVPSYSSRYNLNTCYNEIRQDLLYLQQQGVFRYHYPETDENGKSTKSWQSVLQTIANAADLRYDIPLDAYEDGVSRALLEAMDTLNKDASFRPLKEFTRIAPSRTRMPLDRFVFLMGTMRAAKNARYNEQPSMDDAIRGPYYIGEKNIYDLDDVDGDFRIGFDTDYIIVYVACVALIWDLAVIILNCIARIFNMLFLYLMAPPIFASQPLDNGGKTKQWLTAFLVQSLSVFGTVIAMQLLLIVLPIIAGSELVLFENGLLNIMAKLVLVYGVFEVAKKATALFTGILADSAGWQSIQAGDMSASATKAVGGAAGLATGALGKAAGVAGRVGAFAVSPATNLISRGFNATLGRVGSWWSSLGRGSQAPREANAAGEQGPLDMPGWGEPDSPPSPELPHRSDAPPSEQSQTPQPGGRRRAPLSEGAQKLFGVDANGQVPPKPSAPARPGGQRAPLSEGAQKLFGVDANGQVPPKPSAPSRPGGQRAPLSEGAQKLFGVDENGQVPPKSSAPARSKAAGQPQEAPPLSNRPSLDGPVMTPPPRRPSFSGGGEKDLPDNKK